MDDIRMRGFISRHDLDPAIKLIKENINPIESEIINFENAYNRITSENIISDKNIPDFNKSAMDGYALCAKDTFGASMSNPIIFDLIGEIHAGDNNINIKDDINNNINIKDDINNDINNHTDKKSHKKNQAFCIMTGSAVPDGFDSVIKAENTELLPGKNKIRVFSSVSPGNNISAIGEDIKKNELVIKSKTILCPEHIGVLASIQRLKIKVYKKPKIGIIITGSEIISPHQNKKKYQTVDSNSYILKSMVEKYQCIPKVYSIIPDDKEQLSNGILTAVNENDMIIITGGTSVGKKDLVPIIIDELGVLIIHGITMRPGSPTGFGIVNKIPVFLLVGNPAGAMIGFYNIIVPAIKRKYNNSEIENSHKIMVRLNRKIASVIGRTDFVRVNWVDKEITPIRTTGAGMLSTMTKACGYVIVPKNLEGYNKGELIEVHLFD